MNLPRGPVRESIVAVLALGAAVSGCLCPGGQLMCDGQCVDPLTHQTNCGACGRACTFAERCDGANCVRLPTCGPTAPSPITCDDGDACNGVHQCIDGQCYMTTPPPRCDDGVACTVSTCAPGGSCVHTPDDSLCDEGLVCAGSSGCMEPCPHTPCSIVRQCGCSDGDKCSHEGGSSGECGPTGTEAQGSSCTRSSECAAGLVCLALTGFDGGRCSIPCASAADCGGLHCFRELGYETTLGNGERFSRCEQRCDPVDARECARGQSCIMFGSAESPLTYCGETDASGVAGAACERETDCAPGYTCIRYTDRLACGELCHEDRDCSGGRRCFDFDTAVTVHGEPVGSCG